MPIKDEQKLKEAQKRANEKRDNHHTWEFTVFVDDIEKVNPIWLDEISSHPERRNQDVFPLTLTEARRKLGYEIYVSPLHDKNPSGIKKHHHIVVHSNNKISMQQALSVADLITLRNEDGNYVGIPMYAESRNLSNALRYCLHLDDGDKAKYNPDNFVIIDNCEPLPKIKFTTKENGLYRWKLLMLVDEYSFSSSMELQRHLYYTKQHTLYYMLSKSNILQGVDHYIIESLLKGISKQLGCSSNSNDEKSSKSTNVLNAPF